MRKERTELLALVALFVLSPAGISPYLTAAVTGRYASESVLDPLACCNSSSLRFYLVSVSCLPPFLTGLCKGEEEVAC